jgi:uncharacterized membrane protein YebE (DUF533 family)
MGNKLDELLSTMKLGDLVHKKECDKKKHVALCVLAVIGGVAAVAAIAYAVYRYMNPDYLEDFDDEFDDYEEDTDAMDEEETSSTASEE